MKKTIRYSVNFLLLVLSLLVFVSCNNKPSDNSTDNQGGQTPPTTDKPVENKFVDYASQYELKEDFQNKSFLKDGIEEVKLLNSIDGDTIHVSDSNRTELKLRFSGVDTPESTGSVEPWGKKASKFTASKVENTTSLVIQSDKENGEASRDANGRYLTWIWYLDSTTNKYKLLNLELVQEGYSYGKYTSVSKHKDIVKQANDQAVRMKIKVFGEVDKDFSTERLEVDLKTLRTDLTVNDVNSKYIGDNCYVSFEAVVSRISGNTAYVQDVDKETGEIYGIQVFMGFNSYNKIKVGNRVQFTGRIEYYKVGQTFQLTDIQDTGLGSWKDLVLVSKDNKVEATPITPDKLVTTDTNLIYNLVRIENATVKSVYVTTTEGSSSKGAMTLTCEANGLEFSIRTVVLVYKEGTNTNIVVDKNNIVQKETFEGKTISINGIVELHNGQYQVKLVSIADCEFVA